MPTSVLPTRRFLRSCLPGGRAHHSPAGVHVCPFRRSRGPSVGAGLTTRSSEQAGRGSLFCSSTLVFALPVAELEFVRRSEAPVRVSAFQSRLRPSPPVGRLPLPGGHPSFPVGRPSFPASRLPLPASRWRLPGGHPSLPEGRPSLPGDRLPFPEGRLPFPGGLLCALARPRVGARSRLTTRSSERRLAGASVPWLSPFSPASVAELGFVRRHHTRHLHSHPFNMKAYLPSPLVINGLCAGFFYAAAARLAGYALAFPAIWRLAHYSPPVLGWVLWVVGLSLLSVGCAWVGFRLLYKRARCVLHALVFGWVVLTLSVINPVRLVYIAGSGQLPLWRWPDAFFESAVPFLASGATLGLLYWLRLPRHYDVGPVTSDTHAA